MKWFTEYSATQPIASSILLLSIIAVAGLSIAAIKIRGIGLGIAGVLFAGILFGHFHFRIDHPILEFTREFGLILFVFTIGLQLGPGFFASLKKEGLKLNLLAASVVLLGFVSILLSAKLLGINLFAAAGLFSGATTNTPSLGAAQQTIKALGASSAEVQSLPGQAYAVSYPLGILGIISALLILKMLFRIDPEREAGQFHADQKSGIEPLERINVLVENSNLSGLTIREIPGRRELGIVISRIKRSSSSEAEAAREETRIQPGDVLLAVGIAHKLKQFCRIAGRESEIDLTKLSGRINSQRLVVTRKEVLGKSIRELGFDQIHSVTVTRLIRAGVEMIANSDLRLQFGDILQIVGDEEGIRRVTEALGNSWKALNETNLIPIFTGIALGVFFGSLPIYFPGMPVPVKLGLAGGPLILAIILSRIGKIGPIVWYMPLNANLAFREFGIVLFLACVGLKAGESFLSTILTRSGMLWVLIALLTAIVPVLIVGVYCRVVLKLNYVTLSGLLAGSMTDPPALAFASAMTKSDSASVAYATVYPLTMLLRILAVQILLLTFR